MTSLFIFGFFSSSVFKLVDAEKLSPYYWLIPLGVLAQGIYTAFRYWTFKKRNFKAITKTAVNQSIYKNGFMVSWGIFFGTSIGLIFRTIIGKSAGIE
ncbi:MAG: hypothetical protein ACTSSG_14525 [Candidatus Heimdallarchaeaceae archaeon]